MEGTTERDEYYDYTRRVKAKRRNMELNNVISNGQASDFIKLNPDNNCADGSVSYFW